MKTTFACCVLTALLLPIATAPVSAGKIQAGASSTVSPTTAPAQNVPASQPAGRGGPAEGGELAALERKLLRAWQGPDCGGDFTFNPDGTFEVRHYTPANYTLGGAWSLRWDALPPTLLLTFKSSDFKKRDPGGPDYKYVGKTLEAKLLELDSEVLAFRVPNTEWNWRNLPPGREVDGRLTPE
jgi:hypothetical protein